jgi:hypothetical protein
MWPPVWIFMWYVKLVLFHYLNFRLLRPVLIHCCLGSKTPVYFWIERLSYDDSLALHSSPSDSLIHSITEDEDRFQSRFSQTTSRPEGQDLPGPFNIRAVSSDGPHIELFVDIGLLRVAPPRMALRPSRGIFFFRDGNLIFRNPGGEIVQPIGDYGRLEFSSSKQTRLGWKPFKHQELGLVLAPTFNGIVLREAICLYTEVTCLE